MNTSPESHEEDDELDENLDDELLETPAEAREWILSELAEEQDNGRIRKAVSKKAIEEMVSIQCKNGYGDLLALCVDHFPTLITKAGKRDLEEEADTHDQVKMEGKYAPEVTISDIQPRRTREPDATAKQLNFLRRLGVRDEKLLASLGVGQASAAISATLEARDRELFGDRSDTDSKTKKSGLRNALIIFVVVALVTIAISYYRGLQ